MSDNEEKNIELLEACGQGDVSKVKNLLETGANAAFEHNVPGTWGAYDKVSPIHKALSAKENSSEIVALLLKNRASVNCKEEHYDWRGCGSGHSAFEIAMDKAKSTGNVDILREFLKYNADPNQTSHRDIHSMRTDGRITQTLLTSAASSNNVEILKCLLEGGADPNKTCSESIHNEYGTRRETTESALHISAGGRNDEDAAKSVEVLLENGADINAIRTFLHQEVIEKPNSAKDIDEPREIGFHSGLSTKSASETALHIAINSGNCLVVKCLVDHNADMSIKYHIGDEYTSVEDLVKKVQDDDIRYSMEIAIGIKSRAKSANK